MAKKGQQQLQAELNSDDDLLVFLKKRGVILMDVYTEWCGPCTAMLANLKKIKLELGGDNLHLALVKADTVDLLKRFREKSETTWLFASGGKIVNIAFGCNVPNLIRIITSELELEEQYQAGTANRKFYELTELLPIEQARYDKKKVAAEAEAKREREEQERKRREYLTFVLSEIDQHANDLGVTVFMPHTMKKDLFRLVSDIGEKCGLTPKEKANITITEEDLKCINFDCVNPINPAILEHINEQELLAVCWKLPETELRPTEEIIAKIVDLLTVPQPINPGQVLEEGQKVLKYPPVLKNLLIDTSIVDVEDEADGESMDISIPNDSEKSGDEEATKEGSPESTVENAGATSGNESVESPNKDESNSESLPLESTIESGEAEDGEMQAEEYVEDFEAMKARRGSNVLIIPPLWTPENRNANAMLVYLYFRGLIDHFLPPDPVPEPPHCIIMFDAFKRRDIIDLCERYQDDILAYGYFTTDDPDTAELVAASTLEYTKRIPDLNDKLVIKVSILKENALFALSSFGPTNVSVDAEQGEIDGLKFFPELFVQGSEIPEEVEGEEEGGEGQEIAEGEDGEVVEETQVEAEGEGGEEGNTEAAEGTTK